MIIGILTDPATGGTFIDWSVNYLAGNAVSKDPVQASNAHGHWNERNMIMTKNQFDKWIPNIDQTVISTVYMHHFKETDIEKLTKDYHYETAECFKQLQNVTDKIIVCSLQDAQKLYHCTRYARVLQKKFKSYTLNTTFEEQHREFVDTFFGHDKHKFDDTIWEYREFLALNIRPMSSKSIMPNVDTSKPFYQLDPWELFCNFNIEKLFKWLGLDIVQSRVAHWQTVYTKWKKIHTQRVNFATDFRLIIDNILAGNHLDLTVYNLDIVQEAAIQHELIYTYNLNFKIWQLDKFKNTYQLHQLLEPNIHLI